jgi:hypothetical protein
LLWKSCQHTWTAAFALPLQTLYAKCIYIYIYIYIYVCVCVCVCVCSSFKNVNGMFTVICSNNVTIW